MKKQTTNIYLYWNKTTQPKHGHLVRGKDHSYFDSDIVETITEEQMGQIIADIVKTYWQLGYDCVVVDSNGHQWTVRGCYYVPSKVEATLQSAARKQIYAFNTVYKQWYMAVKTSRKGN